MCPRQPRASSLYTRCGCVLLDLCMRLLVRHYVLQRASMCVFSKRKERLWAAMTLTIRIRILACSYSRSRGLAPGWQAQTALALLVFQWWNRPLRAVWDPGEAQMHPFFSLNSPSFHSETIVRIMSDKANTHTVKRARLQPGGRCVHWGSKGASGGPRLAYREIARGPGSTHLALAQLRRDQLLLRDHDIAT